MKTMVVGLGALGTVFSCLLKENGHEVWGVDQESVVKAVKEKGVCVNGIWGDHSTHLDRVGSIEEIVQMDIKDFDLVIVTVKSFHTAGVAKSLVPFLSENTHVLLAQNGYGNYETAVQFIPENKLIQGRVIFGAETESVGVSKVTVIADDVLIGSPGNKIDAGILEHFAAIFSEAGIPTRSSSEIMKYLWGKIIYNSALNPLGAILELTYGELAMDGQSKVIMDGIIKEIFAVLAAMKQETLWPNAEAYMREFYDKLIPATRRHHSSMLQDIRAGRKTEIDALNGAICRLGKEYGIDTPANEMMRTMLRNKELLMESDED